MVNDVISLLFMCAQQSVIRNTRLILITQNYPVQRFTAHFANKLTLLSRCKMGTPESDAGTGWGWGQKVTGTVGDGDTF